jgi:hypothetical protein
VQPWLHRREALERQHIAVDCQEECALRRHGTDASRSTTLSIPERWLNADRQSVISIWAAPLVPFIRMPFASSLANRQIVSIRGYCDQRRAGFAILASVDRTILSTPNVITILLSYLL